MHVAELAVRDVLERKFLEIRDEQQDVQLPTGAEALRLIALRLSEAWDNASRGDASSAMAQCAVIRLLGQYSGLDAMLKAAAKRAGREPNVHELDLVEHPERILVQEPE